MARSLKKRRRCESLGSWETNLRVIDGKAVGTPDASIPPSWICCKCKGLRSSSTTKCLCGHERCGVNYKPKPRKMPTRFNRAEPV